MEDFSKRQEIVSILFEIDSIVIMHTENLKRSNGEVRRSLSTPCKYCILLRSIIKAALLWEYTVEYILYLKIAAVVK